MLARFDASLRPRRPCASCERRALRRRLVVGLSLHLAACALVGLGMLAGVVAIVSLLCAALFFIARAEGTGILALVGAFAGAVCVAGAAGFAAIERRVAFDVG
jgi:hypothetical protein